MRRTVKNQFESLLAAVIDDDRTSLKALLKKYPSLSTRTVERAWLEVRLPHWVYAGDTVLHVAAAGYRTEIARMLLEAGADARLKNLPGSTPFHLAVQNTGRGGSGSEIAKAAQGEIIRVFLERDIGPALKDTRGKSVSDWARSEWIREMLVSA